VNRTRNGLRTSEVAWSGNPAQSCIQLEAMICLKMLSGVGSAGYDAGRELGGTH